MFKRIFMIVIDSVGVGELDDAYLFGDENVNTIKSISEVAGPLLMPNMEKLGFGHITEINGVEPIKDFIGNVTKCKELSNGKDTMTGHWELMGIETKQPFVTFTDTGFPKELLDEITRLTGRNIVGNKSASGTEIIKEYGEHQIKTGDLIVYTSADSVLQICGHETHTGLDELYKACEIARELTLNEPYRIGRVIARPYVGENKDEFVRTSNRHDYALKPPHKTTLNYLKEASYDVISFGKIKDIYDGEGITDHFKHSDNHHGMMNYVDYAKKYFNGLAYLNLVDFDMLYGHRRDPLGYKECLEEFDEDLGLLLKELKEDDLLIITADHGNDPTYHGTDHTREYVPLIAYSSSLQPSILEVRETFADIGATISDNFNVNKTSIGKSFLSELKKK